VAATGISLHTATLNGTVNPHAQATNAWFEWGTDNALLSPTLTDNQAIGAGSADNSVSAPITGLELGTTYYYRVTATNASGTQKGAIESFTTALPNSPPSVTTSAATLVTISSATLNGTVSPNELPTTAWFEWGTDPNLVTSTPTSSQPLGAGTTSVAINAPLSGLIPGTTYYFRVAATNSAGTSKGTIVSFAPLTQAPTVATGAATLVTLSGATLNGTVNPNGLAVSDAHFEYGTDSNLTTFTATTPQPLAAGFTGQGVTAPLSGLIPGTTYYFRVAATNSAGTSKGLIVSFNTVAQPPTPPTVVTTAATSVTSSGATLNGTVNPNGLATDAYFKYGTDPALATSNTTSTQSMGSGGTVQPITASLSGLTPGTIYYFQVVATNAGGASQATILSFPTPVSPTITTNSPTSITATSAIFNGSVNPNGLSTTAWFEYGTDPFLSSWTNTASQAKGSSKSPQSYNWSISGLSSYTTYYYRAAASNSGGTQKGVINSFLTGETHVAVGDSITAGSHDDILADGIGYEPILADFLGVMIANDGVSGYTSADGAATISTTLSNNPSANYFLIMYGTNDAWIPPIPSGKGLNPGSIGYSGSYKDHMQQIISAVLGAGKTPYLAKVPYSSHPLISDASIREYNTVINELVVANNITVTPPDFYTWFLSNPSQLADTVHPNGTGYKSMASLWFSSLY
jgi:lysophospholipase L1-like esterase